MINTQHNIKYITNPYKIWIIDNFMITEVINKINQEWLENDAKQWHSGRAMVGGKTNILEHKMLICLRILLQYVSSYIVIKSRN